MPFQARVDVLPDANVEVHATLVKESKDAPWYKRWYVWATVGGAVAAGGAATAIISARVPNRRRSDTFSGRRATCASRSSPICTATSWRSTPCSPTSSASASTASSASATWPRSGRGRAVLALLQALGARHRRQPRRLPARRRAHPHTTPRRRRGRRRRLVPRAAVGRASSIRAQVRAGAELALGGGATLFCTTARRARTWRTCSPTTPADESTRCSTSRGPP